MCSSQCVSQPTFYYCVYIVTVWAEISQEWPLLTLPFWVDLRSTLSTWTRSVAWFVLFKSSSVQYGKSFNFLHHDRWQCVEVNDVKAPQKPSQSTQSQYVQNPTSSNDFRWDMGQSTLLARWMYILTFWSILIGDLMLSQSLLASLWNSSRISQNIKTWM